MGTLEKQDYKARVWKNQIILGLIIVMVRTTCNIILYIYIYIYVTVFHIKDKGSKVM